MKVLIVEDTETNRTLLTWILEDHGHEVIEATDGQQGVALFKQHHPDLVLMDVMMPIMDGVEATKAIRSYLGNTHVPIIFLTALSDDASLTRCLDVGGDDFISKPINEKVLKAKINAHNRIKELNEQLASKNRELMNMHNITVQEHKIAKKVFESALSASILDNSNVRHYISPAAQFNGDLLMIALSPMGSLYGLVADFTGHGLPAAIGALPMSKIFYDAVERGASVSSIAKELNHDLGKFLPADMFAAATIVELNTTGKRLTMWIGGMPDAIVTDEAGTLKRTIESSHMPLGILEDNEFERDCYVLDMDIGDRLYIYTDGIPEARNQEGDMLGEERLMSHFKGNCEDPFSELIQDTKAFSSQLGQADDITLLELLCKPIELCLYPRDTLKGREHLIGWTLSTRLTPKEFRSTSNPIAQVVDYIGNAKGVENHKDYLNTILTELYTNALEHSLLNLSSDLKQTDEGYQAFFELRKQRLTELTEGNIEINISFSTEAETGDGLVTLNIKDDGQGFSADCINNISDDAACGRGMTLVKALCDHLSYSDSGRQVTAIYRIKAV